MNSKKAFTLIELLVVIAIIALLLSILIPSLKKVKDIASTTLCGNNARQIMSACMMYSIDNNDQVPRAVNRYNLESTNPNWNFSWACLPVKNPSSNPTHTMDFLPAAAPMNADLDQRLAGIRHGTIYPYLKSTEVYNCSRDTRLRKAGKDGGYRSYSLNETIFHGGGAAWGPTAKKTNQVRNPSGRMAVIEQGDARGFNWDGLVFSSLGVNDWEEPLAYWHQGGFMYACFDGHVERYVLKNEGTKIYNDIFVNNPAASIYYSNHSELSAYPANQNIDFYNITRMLDNFGHTTDSFVWDVD